MELNKRNLLKIIASISMLIDHVGLALFSNNFFMRYLGRFAFPIFSYQFVDSYFYTKHRKKFILRILLTAIISQVVYMMLFCTYKLNILFSFVIYAGIMWTYEWMAKYSYKWTMPFNVFILCSTYIHIYWFLEDKTLFAMDWGETGIMFMTMFYLYKKYRDSLELGIPTLINCSFLMTMICLNIKNPYYLVGSIFAMWLIDFVNRVDIKKDFKLSKYFGYVFYPAHLSVILLIKLFIS